MNVRQMRTFVAVAEAGSFTDAARRLGAAQPGLSRDVRLIEEELKVELLVRGSQGVSLTAAGERLYHHARSMIQQFEIIPDVVAGGESIAGRVSIGLPHSTSAVLALPLLKAIRQKLPLVQIHLVESVSGFLQEWVENGRLDMAVVYDSRSTPSVEVEALGVEELCLVGRRDSPLLAQEHVAFSRLDGVPLLLPGTSHAHRRSLEALALSHGISLNTVMEVDSLAVTLSLAEAGTAFAILAREAARMEIDAGRLAASPVTDPGLTRSVALATSALRDENRACEAVRGLVLHTTRELVSEGAWPMKLTRSG